MPKHKKTREQKIITSQKHQETSHYYSLSDLQPAIKAPPITVPIAAVRKTSYAYVTHDLQKTARISTGLILLQILIYFSLIQHIVKIPFVSY